MSPISNSLIKSGSCLGYIFKLSIFEKLLKYIFEDTFLVSFIAKKKKLRILKIMLIIFCMSKNASELYQNPSAGNYSNVSLEQTVMKWGIPNNC